jgi:hypothetical protein
MKAEGKILQPVYDAADKQQTKKLYYISYLQVMVGPKKYEHHFETSVETFDGLKTKEDKKSYTDWVESYLKRSVGTMMLNEGANFTYA